MPLFRMGAAKALMTSCTGLLLASCTGQLGAPTTVEVPDPDAEEGSPRPGKKPGASSKPDAVAANELPGAALAAATGLRRLTGHEYDNTLRDLLGDGSRPSRPILIDAREPFDNDYTAQVASKALVDGLELLAREATQRLLADKARRDTVLGCAPTGPDDAACFRNFLARFGRRALRRPFGPADVARYEKAFFPLAGEAGDFNAAVEAALQSFLQHGELVYRVEVGAPVSGQPGLHRLNDWEIATRLSYLLWGTTPDDALLDLAQGGKLGTAEGVRGAATRLLQDKRARETVNRFHALWLRYDGMTPPSPELGAAMMAESAALVDRVVFEQRRPWQDLFRLEETFVSPALAKHYGLTAPAGDAGWVKLDGTGRRGILGHATFLSNGAKAGDTSPTMRGIAIRELLLCEEIPPPPPGVSTDEPPQAKGEATCKEDRYKVHAEGGCAGCHKLIDPVGFGLEAFDQHGRLRSVEEGKPSCAIRGEGELVGLGTFRGPGELSDLLLKTGRLSACAVTQLYKYAVGRHKLDENDHEVVALLGERTRSAGGEFLLTDLLLDFVSAEAFRHRRDEP